MLSLILFYNSASNIFFEVTVYMILNRISTKCVTNLHIVYFVFLGGNEVTHVLIGALSIRDQFYRSEKLSVHIMLPFHFTLEKERIKS